MKVKKIEGNKYEIKETLVGTEQTSHIDKVVLEQAIVTLKQEITRWQELLAYKENLLKEIKKVE